MARSALLSALRTVGTPVCVDAADRLESASDACAEFDLHLRRSGLNPEHAKTLSEGISRSTSDDGPQLKSFSASYNPELGDAVTMLVQALPHSIVELGLVGCSITDVGGRALLEWAKTAPNLEMMCVEGNRFSAQLHAEFEDLALSGVPARIVV